MADQLDLVRCEICKKLLKEPVMLPCGEVCCKECVSSYEKGGSNCFLCYFCHQEHEVPKSGFKTNNKVERLVRSLMESRFKMLSDSTKAQEKQLTSDEGIDKIKNHCSLLRYDVELKTKFATDDINQIHDFLIEKINEYEKKAINEYENKEDYKQEIDRLDFSIEDFLEKFHSFLNLKSLIEI
ncbi:E3 ubiquitin- ligase TRIM21-like isoform X1 [Brachionus plicatilis]|uniref:E3 ubiquitin-ligase TRIM21-like isoform X1 n=1 Tax=Brachionus plicatilis TaxID=10195 RepID=A0A3M7PUD4_BRAPC|nr:E3 ubiquitin- ligase TRIM21-like isoform X1 [Brachionus plicatilis]